MGAQMSTQSVVAMLRASLQRVLGPYIQVDQLELKNTQLVATVKRAGQNQTYILADITKTDIDFDIIAAWAADAAAKIRTDYDAGRTSKG